MILKSNLIKESTQIRLKMLLSFFGKIFQLFLKVKIIHFFVKKVGNIIRFFYFPSSPSLSPQNFQSVHKSSSLRVPASPLLSHLEYFSLSSRCSRRQHHLISWDICTVIRSIIYPSENITASDIELVSQPPIFRII